MLRKHFRDHAWAMRVPRQLQERAMAVRDATEELTGRLGRTPRRSELAGYLHAEPATVAQAMRAARVQRLPSLDQAVAGAPDPGFDRVDDRLAVRQLLGRLPARERRALALRYGDGDGDGLTYAAVAAELGISASGAALLLGRSLDALRR